MSLTGWLVAGATFWAIATIHERYSWWSKRGEQARETLFESESVLYYSYMKDVVNAPSFLEGIKGLLWHKRTEYPYEMNVIQRWQSKENMANAERFYRLTAALADGDKVHLQNLATFIMDVHRDAKGRREAGKLLAQAIDAPRGDDLAVANVNCNYAIWAMGGASDADKTRARHLLQEAIDINERLKESGSESSECVKNYQSGQYGKL